MPRASGAAALKYTTDKDSREVAADLKTIDQAATVLEAEQALEAFAQKQLVFQARNVMARAWQGARFAADMTDADSMVAAGGN